MGYVYADLPRHGLGNLLFPWSRAALYAHEHGLNWIEPRWGQLRVGPYRRKDADKRQYGRLFHRQGVALRVARRLRLHRSELLSELSDQPDGQASVRVFTGMGDFFSSLTPHRSLIRSILADGLRDPGWLSFESSHNVTVAHIRLGDFARVGAHGAGNVATPLAWYVAAVDELTRLGERIIVCSDGSESELAPVLNRRNVTLSRGNNPMQDLGLIANANLVLGSGSTFSAWGTFLGARTMLVAPGMNRYLAEDPKVHEVGAEQLEEAISVIDR